MSSWDWLAEQREKNPAAEAATPRYCGPLEEHDGVEVSEAWAFTSCRKLPKLGGGRGYRTCLKVVLDDRSWTVLEHVDPDHVVWSPV